MNTLRLLGILGVFLLALPAVAAQGLVSNPILVMGVNTLILWLLIYLLVVIFYKEVKENQTIFGLVSLGIAFAISFFFVGSVGFIWQVGPLARFFSIQFLVNTAAIAVALYVGARLFGVEMQEKEQRAGSWVVILIIAGFAASTMQYYFWQAGTFGGIFQFLFGPTGILTISDGRIFIFIVTSVLFTMLFKVLGVSSENQKINIAMALVMGANFASAQDPMSIGSLVFIAQVILGLVFFTNLRGQFDSGYTAFIISWLVVDFVGNAAFPEHAWGFTDVILGGFSLGVLPSAGLLIALVVALYAWKILGKGAGGGGIFSEGTRRLWGRVRGDFAEGTTLGQLNDALGKDPLFEGEIQPRLKQLRFEIFSLVSYIQRHEVYETKRKTLAQYAGDIERGEQILEGAEVSPEVFGARLKELIEGASTDEGKGMGIAHLHKFIEEMVAAIADELTDTALERADNKETSRDFESKRDTTLEAHEREVVSIKSRYDVELQRFQALRHITAYRHLLIDLYNVHGQHVRGYGFVHSPATARVFNYRTSSDGVSKVIDWLSVHYAGEGSAVANDEVLEVDMRGFCVDDINAIQINGEDRPLRQFKLSDVKFVPPSMRFSQLVKFIQADWDNYTLDLERARYHPYTRKIDDYRELFSQGKFDFSQVKFANKLGPTEVGFDQEALKDPGKFTYWGRATYSDTGEASVPENNPWPSLSVFGLWQFVGGVARQKIIPEVATEQLRQFVSMNYNTLSTEEVEGGVAEAVPPSAPEMPTESAGEAPAQGEATNE